MNLFAQLHLHIKAKIAFTLTHFRNGRHVYHNIVQLQLTLNHGSILYRWTHISLGLKAITIPLRHDLDLAINATGEDLGS